MTLVRNVSGGDTVFNDGVIIYNWLLLAHVLKHLHGRCISGPFEKVFYDGTLWRGIKIHI